MLTAAALGMFGYGLYSAAWGLVDLAVSRRLEIVADAGLVLFGLMLALAAVFVRVLVPGGLALGIGALLGLQAMSLHTDAHLHGSIPIALQIVRGSFGAALVALAWAGARAQRTA